MNPNGKLNNQEALEPTPAPVGTNTANERKNHVGLGYEDQCTTCTSPHRAEIERRLFGGESLRSVSNWLRNEHGVRITADSLCRHRQKHCDVGLEVRTRIAEEQVKASQPGFEEQVTKVLADAATLDAVAAAAVEVLRASAEGLKKGARSVHDVNLFTAASMQARGAVMDKHLLLGGDKPGKGSDGDSSLTLADLEAIRAAAAANEAA